MAHRHAEVSIQRERKMQWRNQKGCTRFDVSKQLKDHVNNFNRELETTEKSLMWQLSKLPKHFKLNITTDAF